MTSGQLFLVGAFYLVMAATIAFACLRGDQTERQSAILLTALLALQLGLGLFLPARYDAVDPVRLLIDALGFAGFFWIALHSRRFWPLLAAALQLLSLGSHIARAMHLGVDPSVYAWMKSAPTFFVLVALLVGTVNYQRRKRRASSQRSFPASSSRAAERSSRRRSPSSPARPTNGSSSSSSTTRESTSAPSSARESAEESHST